MDTAANEAELIRQTALNLGMNPADYAIGSETSLGNATQAGYYLRNQDMQRLFNLPSLKQMQKDRQQEYMDAGNSRSWARFLARQDANELSRDLSAQYIDGMQAYGVNSDGSINDFGFALANKWAKDDPQSASLYLQSYANPLAQFQAENQLNQFLLGQQGQNERLTASLMQDYWKALDRNALAEAIAKLQAGLEQQRIDKNYEVNMGRLENDKRNTDINQQRLNLDVYKAQAKLQNDLLEAWKKSPEGRVAEAYALGRALGKTGDELTAFIQAQFTQPAGTKEVEIATNNFSKAFDAMKDLYEKENFEAANKALDNLENLISNPESEFKYVPLSTNTVWKRMIDLYRKAANREISKSELHNVWYQFEQWQNGVPYSRDQYMDYLQKHPEELNALIQDAKKKYDKINFSSDIVANSEKFAQTYTPGGNYNTPTYHGNGW